MWFINHLSEWLRPSLTGKRDPVPPVECLSALLMAPQKCMGEASHPPGLCWVWADHCPLPANQRGVWEARTAQLMLPIAQSWLGLVTFWSSLSPFRLSFFWHWFICAREAVVKGLKKSVPTGGSTEAVLQLFSASRAAPSFCSWVLQRKEKNMKNYYKNSG